MRKDAVIHVAVEPATKQELIKLAKAFGDVAVSAVIRRAIEVYLAQHRDFDE